jgi:hypothetical protein
MLLDSVLWNVWTRRETFRSCYMGDNDTVALEISWPKYRPIWYRMHCSYQDAWNFGIAKATVFCILLLLSHDAWNKRTQIILPRIARTLKVGRLRCPETSVNWYHHTLRKNPEERRPQIYFCHITEHNFQCKILFHTVPVWLSLCFVMCNFILYCFIRYSLALVRTLFNDQGV